MSKGIVSEAERERLAILAEECGEVVQAIGKVLRHGYGSRKNREDLAREITDLSFAVELMRECEDVFYDWPVNIEKKSTSLCTFSHHQLREDIAKVRNTLLARTGQVAARVPQTNFAFEVGETVYWRGDIYRGIEFTVTGVSLGVFSAVR